jgi:hypothetical protein
MRDHRLHHREIGVEIAAVAKWKTGADQAIAQVGAARERDAAVVEESARVRAWP